MTNKERLLTDGLLEALEDLAFIRDRQTDPAMYSMVDAAYVVGALYLTEAEEMEIGEEA